MSRRVLGAGGGGCFPAGVMVMTPTGETPIEQLKIGDEVLSFSDTGRIDISTVEVVHTHPEDDILRLEYWGGSQRITANHWVLNQYNTFALAGTLTEHDALVDSLGHLRPLLETHDDGREPVYNLTVTPNHTFIADNIRVHNGGRGATRPIIGHGGGGGKGGGGSHVPVEDPDSLHSHQFASVVDLVSEGEIGGLVNGLASVFINDTPILNPDGTSNFAGVSLDTRNGTQSQTSMVGFSDVENETAVGVEITNRSVATITRSTTYTLGQIFAAPTSSLPVLFKCTFAGISGVSEPSWPAYVGSTVTDGGVTWTAVDLSIIRSTAYAVGVVLPVAGQTEFDFQCTVAGTTSGTAPTWPTTVNTTVVDGTATWKAVYKGIAGSVTRTITNPNTNTIRVTLEVPSLTYQDPSTGDMHGTAVDVEVDLQTAGGGFIAAGITPSWKSTATTGTPTSISTTGQGIGGSVYITQGADGAGVKQPIEYIVEYQLPGSGTWVTAEIGHAAYSSTVSTFTGWLSGLNYTINTKTIYGATGPSGTWNMRVRVTSTYGSAYFNASYAATILNKDTISGKTTSRYRRSYDIPVTGTGPWDVRIRRLTADSQKSNLSNKTYFSSYTQVIESKFSYPNSALMALRIDAAQFTSIPSRGYEIYGIKVQVPSNYNPISRVYTGIWDGTFVTAWTDNPAWVYYDIATKNRYGLGRHIALTNVDKWALYAIAQYCDELVDDGLGNKEPRFTCNMYIQTRQEGLKLLNDISSIFRGMSYWAAGQMTAVADMPHDPVALFTAGNVIDGMFNYSGSSRKARHTVALVTWNDPTDRYRQKIEYVEDKVGIARYGVIEAPIVAIGCTSKGQAHRAGLWLLYTERLEAEVVTFKTALEGSFIRPGDIIKTSDPARANTRMAGRSLAVTSTSIGLDSPITINAAGFTLSMMLPDGTVTTVPVTNSVSATPVTSLTWGTPLATLPLVGSIWVAESPALAAELWRVLSVVESDKIAVEITAVAHDPNKYALVEQGIAIQNLPTSLVMTGAPATPTNLTASESLYVQGPGVIGTKVHFSWQSSAASYKVQWKATDGNLKTLPCNTNYIDLPEMEELTYELRVIAVSALGMESVAAITSYTVIGKAAPPANVTGLTATLRDGAFIDLTWDKNTTDLDFAFYRVVRFDASDVVIDEVTANKKTSLPAYIGNNAYKLYCVDTSGNVSVTPNTVTLTVAAPGAVPVAGAGYAQFGTDFVLNWNNPTSDLTVGKYVISHTGGTFIANATGNTYRVTGDWLGLRNFNVTAVTEAGTAGAASANIGITITAPTAPGAFTASLVGAKAQFTWNASTATLGIAEYEIVYGATFGAVGSISLGRVTATSMRISADWLGNRDFWIRAYDQGVNANPGATSTFRVSITVPLAPTPVSNVIAAENVTIKWNVPSSSIPIDVYEVTYGPSRISLGKVKGTTLTRKVDWVGDRTFYVTAIDLNGRAGAEGSTVSSVVAPPMCSGLSAQVIDNNVLLSWTPVAGTLPISTFEVRKGATYAGSALVGNVSAGFSNIFESVGATYTYWITAFDSALNPGTPKSYTVTVAQPPDYVLRSNMDSTFAVGGSTTAVTLSSAILDAGVITLPFNTTDTFTTHFTGHSWTSPQDQVTAGYPYFAQPVPSSGYYEETVDFGQNIDPCSITVTPTQVLVGAPTITATISVKLLAGDPWTDFTGLVAFVQKFRYMKIRYAVASTGVEFVQISGLNYRLSAKLKSDGGMTSLVSTDTLGTIANFNVEFLSVSDITFTMGGTTRLSYVYDFHNVVDAVTYTVTSNVVTVNHTSHPYVVGQKIRLSVSSGTVPTGVYQITSIATNSYTFTLVTPNVGSSNATVFPQSMRLYAFDSAGARYTGMGSWSVSGY